MCLIYKYTNNYDSIHAFGIVWTVFSVGMIDTLKIDSHDINSLWPSDAYIFFNICSGNGLLADGNKPLPEQRMACSQIDP